MTDESARQTVLFPDLFDKPLKAAFDQPHASSDGGAVLLKATDRRLGLTSAVAATMVDRPDPVKVRHSVQDLMAQRVFGIACGYSDANDADALAEDPMQKLLLDRDPVNGERLASQPTLSRFENRATPRTLFRMAEALTDTVLRHHRRRLHGRVRRITVDLDVTDDPTHGAQQLTFFNGHYDSWCYLPLLAFVTFDDEPEQYLVAALLRPGNAAATAGVLGLLKRLLPRLWQAFPKASIRVRLDGGFASPLVFDILETAGRRVRRGHGRKPGIEARGGTLPGCDTRYRNDHTRDDQDLRRVSVSNAELATRATGDHQGRDRVSGWSGPTGQPSIRRDEHAGLAQGHLRGRLLCQGRHREPDQGTSRWPADRSNELLSFLPEPAARPADRSRVRVASGTPAASPRYRLRQGAGHNASRATDQARRSSCRFISPDRASPADCLSLSVDLATPGMRSGSITGVTSILRKHLPSALSAGGLLTWLAAPAGRETNEVTLGRYRAGASLSASSRVCGPPHRQFGPPLMNNPR